MNHATQASYVGKTWPQEGLEKLNRCPVCNSNTRELLYSGLWDIVFGVAPGQWTLYRCNSCNCAYLDPRPTRETIGMAYQFYYTHAGTGRMTVDNLTPIQHLSRQLANGYRNRHYGTMELPASWFGIIAGIVSPKFRKRIKRSFRCLQLKDKGKQILDIGCGGGNFLYWARAMGCRVFGVEPDPYAASKARAMGFDVREGGIEAFEKDNKRFDIITFGHVIEHMHNPLEALQKAYCLLNPNGRIWLETPNIDSLCSQKYGIYWRGLETPRHLIIFSVNSIEYIVKKAGFSKITVCPVRDTKICEVSKQLARTHGYMPIRRPSLNTETSTENAEAFQLTATFNPENS